MSSNNDISTVFVQDNKEISVTKMNNSNKSNILVKFP